MKHFFLTYILVMFLGGLFAASVAYAQPIFERSGDKATGLGTTEKLTLMECIAGDPARKIPAGSCGAEHLFILSNNIIRWVVGVAGALALFMYIMGGLWMIFSAGSSTRISRGKDILIGTTIALVFILTSWLIVNLVLKGLGVSSEYNITASQCNSNGDCPNGQICYEKQCREQCYVKIQTQEKDPNIQWSCKPPTDCGSIAPFQPLASVADCPNASNCVPGLCSDPATVCCY
jgi:hypothetical protein